MPRKRHRKPSPARKPRPKRTFFSAWILRPLLIAGSLYLFAALALTLFGLRDDARPADVGVVFGNQVMPTGKPSFSLASRLDQTVALYQRGLFPSVIVSGGVGKEGFDEAQVMADYLANRGVPRPAILIDRQGNNTYLTALHTAELAQAHNFHSFVLVSNFYHLPRARLAFTRFGLTPVTAAHARRFAIRDFYYGLMREVVAFPSYLFKDYRLNPTAD